MGNKCLKTLVWALFAFIGKGKIGGLYEIEK